MRFGTAHLNCVHRRTVSSRSAKSRQSVNRRLSEVISLLRWRARVRAVVRSDLIAGVRWEQVSAPRSDFLVGRLWRAVGVQLPTHLTPPHAKRRILKRFRFRALRAFLVNLLLRVRPKGDCTDNHMRFEIALVKTDCVLLLSPQFGRTMRVDRFNGFTNSYVELRKQAYRYLNMSQPWDVLDERALVEAYIDGTSAAEIPDSDFLRASVPLLRALQDRLTERPPQSWLGLEALVVEVQQLVSESSALTRTLRSDEFLRLARRVPCIPMHTEMRRRNLMIRDETVSLIDWDPRNVGHAPVWLPISWILNEVLLTSLSVELNRHWIFLRNMLFPHCEVVNQNQCLAALISIHRPVQFVARLQPVDRAVPSTEAAFAVRASGSVNFNDIYLRIIAAVHEGIQRNP